MRWLQGYRIKNESNSRCVIFGKECFFLGEDKGISIPWPKILIRLDPRSTNDTFLVNGHFLMRWPWRWLSLLFSLGIHGVMASLLISTSYKVVETKPLTVQVLWEKPLEKVGLPHKSFLSHSSQQNTTTSKQSHSRESGNPETTQGVSKTSWVPAFAGMTPPCSKVPKKRQEKEMRPPSKQPTLSQSYARPRPRKGGDFSTSKEVPKQVRDDSYRKASDDNEYTYNAQRTSYTPLPKYPWISRKRGQEGRVYLKVQTNKEGRVTDAYLHKSSGYAPLDQAALDTVKTWILAHNSCQKVISIAFRLKG